MTTIDLHCHPNTEPWYAATAPYVEALRTYWKRPWEPVSEERQAEDLRAAGVRAYLVAHDSELSHGCLPCTNEYVAGFRDRFPDVFAGFWASADPRKGRRAIDEISRAAEEFGAIGVHFHPICQGIGVGDPRWSPLMAHIESLGLRVMVDIGTTGMGAGVPGGLERLIEHARPIEVDRLASRFPDLDIIMGHPGWPWTSEAIAVALHKGNVYWETSGWGPKHFPEEFRREIDGRLSDKIMFGSDYPSLTHQRLFDDWGTLGLSDEALASVFSGNAERILGVPSAP